MALTGNKGEWSEIYTLLKLLGEGTVYAGDQHLSKIADLFYPIVMILRQEEEGHLKYVRGDVNVLVQTSEGEVVVDCPASVFLSEAENLLQAINEGKGSFSVLATEAFMQKIHCHTLKARSSDKTDIRIVLHDRRTRLNAEMGFSIKSQLGGNSTLLNASKATNFTFSICGVSLSDEDIAAINAINTKNKIIDRFAAICARGGSLTFVGMDSCIFYNNLLMLDGSLPTIIAELLLEQLISREIRLCTLVERLTLRNPLGYDLQQPSPYYAYKMKHLLASVALGMMPNAPWNGLFDANGGYLVVKSDGEILCYHFYDRNMFEDYLYMRAYLERASSSRHEYGSIIRGADGSLLFKLNLQIRLC